MDATDTGAVARLADLLARSLETGTPIAAIPADARITSPAEAYRVQDLLRLGPIAGWKVGRKSPTGDADPGAAAGQSAAPVRRHPAARRAVAAGGGAGLPPGPGPAAEGPRL